MNTAPEPIEPPCAAKHFGTLEEELNLEQQRLEAEQRTNHEREMAEFEATLQAATDAGDEAALESLYDQIANDDYRDPELVELADGYLERFRRSQVRAANDDACADTAHLRPPSAVEDSSVRVRKGWGDPSKRRCDVEKIKAATTTQKFHELNRVEAAVWLAANKFPVFQTTDQKRPAQAGWQERATTDVAAVREMYQQRPDRQIGIATGDGLLVLDFDTPTARAELEETIGCALPPTRESRTPRGGHLYFRTPLDLELASGTDVLGVKGFDVRAEGGLVVAPGSQIGEKRYEWKNLHSLADVPDVLVELLPKKGERRQPSRTPRGAANAPRANSGPRQPLTDAEYSAVLDALSHIPASVENDVWYRVTAGMVATGHPKALDDWDTWCRTSPEKYDQAENWRRWESFDADGPITPATVKYIARQYGWVDPAPAFHEHNDDGNKERFATHHEGELLATPGTASFYQPEPDGVWSTLPLDAVASTKTEPVRQMIRDEGRAKAARVRAAAANTDDEGAQGNAEGEARAIISAHERFAVRSGNAAPMNNMVKLAMHHSKLTRDINTFDAHPDFIGVENGVLDIRKHCLVESPRDALITRRLGAAFDPEAKDDDHLWSDTIDQICNGDAALILLMQMMWGYTLLRGNPERKVFLHKGDGTNGKSLINGVMTEVFGDYAAVVQSGTILRQRNVQSGSSPTADLVALRAVRAAMVGEVTSDPLASDFIKNCSGGEPITARAPHAKQNITFTPDFVFHLVGNYMPKYDTSDPAMNKRIIVIPYLADFTGREDLDLPRKLALLKPVILNWMLQGLQMWYENGCRLEIPACAHAYKDESLNENETLWEWFSESYESTGDSADFVSSEALYESYTDYHRGRRLATGNRLFVYRSKRKLTDELLARKDRYGILDRARRRYTITDCGSAKHHNGRGLVGIREREADSDDDRR